MVNKLEKQNERDLQRDLNDALSRSTRLKKVSLDQYSGWADYVQILKDYVSKRLRKKSITDLSIASDTLLAQLKLYDRDVWLINNFIIPLIKNFVVGIEKKIKDQEKKDSVPQ